MKRAGSLFIAIWLLLLVGCGSNGDLKKYVTDILARPGAPIEPLPKIESYRPYHYVSENGRNPFAPMAKVVPGDSMHPDLNRAKEELEAFPLDALKMVGTLNQGPTLWALVQAPDNGIYRVTVGNYMGTDYGLVSKITPEKITLIETVGATGGWTQRTQTIELATPKIDAPSKIQNGRNSNK